MMYLKRTITGGAVVGTDKSEAFLISLGSAPHTLFMIDEFPREFRNSGDLLMIDAKKERFIWTDTVGNSSKLEGKTKAEVIAEARTGYETAAVAVKKYLAIKGKAVDSALLEGKNRASIITDARAGYETAAVAATKYLAIKGKAVDSALLEKKTKAQVIAEARTGYETAAIAVKKYLAIKGKAVDSALLEGKNRASIITESRAGLAVEKSVSDRLAKKIETSDRPKIISESRSGLAGKLKPADYGTGTANLSSVLHGDGTWKPITLHMDSVGTGKLTDRPKADAVNNGSIWVVSSDTDENNGKSFISNQKEWLEITDHKLKQADSRYLAIKGNAVNSLKLESKTKAQVIAEARTGYETAAVAATKYLAIKSKAVDSSKLEGKTKAEVVAEARTGYETAAIAVKKYLAIKGKAADATLLEGKNRASIITEARTGYETAAVAATKYLAIKGKAADATLLEGKNRASIITEARTGYETAAIAVKKYLPIKGKAADADKLDGINSSQFVRNDYLTSRKIADLDAADNTGVNFHYGESTSKNKPSGTDHAVLTQSFSNQWSTQLASDWRTNRWYIRNQNEGKWGGWAELFSTVNKPKAADVIGAFTQALADKRYFLKSGGALTGLLSAPKRLTVAGGATIGGKNVTGASLLIDGSLGIDGNEIYATSDLIIGTIANLVSIKKGTAQLASFDSAGIKEGSTYLKDKYLGKTAKATDSSKLEGKTKAEVIAEARTGYETAAVAATKYLAIKGKAVDSSKLEGKTKAQVVAEARAGLATTDYSYSRVDSNAKYLLKTAKAADADKVDGIQGASLLRSDADDTFTGALIAGNRANCIFGVYDAKKTQAIWSMGTEYKSDVNGANFGNLYGLAYKHINNGTGGAMAGGHQIVFCASGSAKSAMGDGLWTSGNVTAYSDRRVKTNIKRIDDALDKVSKINGYTFDRVDAFDEDGKPLKQTGVIAQEIQKVLPEAVVESGENGHLSVAYGNIVGLLIEAIKDLKQEVEGLRYGIT